MYREIVAVMLVEATVWDGVTVQVVPDPPVIVVPDVMPEPANTCPMRTEPDATALTVKVVAEIEPVNDAPGAPVGIRMAYRAELVEVEAVSPGRVVVSVQSLDVTD